MVLLALRKIPTSNPPRRDACFQRGLNWMLTFQCKDGGWASFDKDCTKGILEKVPFADHNAMLDPECADITARILELLGYENFTWKSRRCKRRWNSSAAARKPTARGTGAGESIIFTEPGRSCAPCAPWAWTCREPWILKARDWLESVQHEDGGWGERCNTYDDPVFKGQGPSTASQTAWAVMGLCAFDDPHRPSLQNGIEHLVRTQNADGTWSETEATGTGFPKVFYLKYDMYRNSWPLLALATYRNMLPRVLRGEPDRAQQPAAAAVCAG